MRSPDHTRTKERGAVAIMFGLTIVALFAMGGVVLDLGHLYIAKAELQNAADAAALAGAKDLNETAAGINNAVGKAQSIAQSNQYNFTTDVTLALANIEFGPGPDGPWSSVALSIANPQGKTFIRVDTGTKVLDTYLMRVAGIDTVSTSGVAVAGRFVVDVTPLGVCALDTVEKAAGPNNELREWGFRRGVTYNIPDLGPLGAAGVPILLNPVDVPGDPAGCKANHSSANFTAPFVCQGNSGIGTSSSMQVYANTGGSYGPIEKALNSRLDLYPGGTACDPTTSPPDSNVKEYGFTTPPAAGGPADWMAPDPVRQSVTIDPATSKPLGWPGNPPAADFGTLWSYTHAVQFAGTQPNYTPFGPADWPTLYPGISATGYPTSAGPAFPAGTPASPYNQVSPSPFFKAPPVHPPGIRNRRLMKIVIVDCAGIGTGGLACTTLPVKGIGRFFLQTRADLTGMPKKIYGEFAGLVQSAPTSEIKLYR